MPGLPTLEGAGGDPPRGRRGLWLLPTFSSFAHVTVWSAGTGTPGRGVANALGTLLAALVAVGLAWLLVA